MEPGVHFASAMQGECACRVVRINIERELLAGIAFARRKASVFESLEKPCCTERDSAHSRRGCQGRARYHRSHRLRQIPQESQVAPDAVLLTRHGLCRILVSPGQDKRLKDCGVINLKDIARFGS